LSDARFDDGENRILPGELLVINPAHIKFEEADRVSAPPISERLYALLRLFVRQRDVDQGEPLRALLGRDGDAASSARVGGGRRRGLYDTGSSRPARPG